MDNKTVFDICTKYSNYVSISDLCKEYHLGALKIKEILNTNNIPIRNKGGVQREHSYVVSDYKIEKYQETDEYYFIAQDKLTGETFEDIKNKGGHLTSHIEKKYGIPTPSLFERRKYYMTTGYYWWEQWFNVVRVNKKSVKKCPYCDWVTTDLENKSGMFMTHLSKVHEITIEEYLHEHPEDSGYFKKQMNIIDKRNKLKEDINFVVCPLCGEKLEKITYWHIRNKHSLDYTKFKKMFPDVKIMSDNMLSQTLSAQTLTNLVVSKKRFISKYEKEIQNLLTEHGINFKANRQILIGKEIDILVEEKKIGIEFDGLKWHTEWFGNKSHNYHLEKTLLCNEKGYGLIHIFEDEYVNHKDIVNAKLLHILGVKNNKKIMGRKCVIKEILKHDAKIFLDKYHIQGYASSSIYLGAFYNHELVAVMSFKNGNLKNSSWELTRFASNYNYICQGVGGKLFKYFIRKYNPNKVISFADRRWTIDINNNLYTKLGFTIDSINRPDYKYYNENTFRYKRLHKMLFNKQKLHKKYGFPLTMTETEMAKELGYDRIWDCGLIKYVWKRKESY